MMPRTSQLLRSTSAATAAEFAMVLPVLLILLFGIIDIGRFLFEYNEAEKATQVGARVAVVTNVLSAELRDENYVGQTVGGKVIGAGDRIPAGALGTILCTSTSCSCATAPCPSGVGTVDSTTFNDVLVARMQQIYPAIQPENVQVRYSGSGLGIAAEPAGSGGPEQMQVSPLITVTLTGLNFPSFTFLNFVRLPMPSFSTTLTAEDASGTFSN
jgi:hypothetical protein